MPRRHRKSTRRRRGGSYGFEGAVAPGAAEVKASTEVPVAGRRRKSRSKSRKTRKTRRGGANPLYGYSGSGEAGMANFEKAPTE